MLLIPNVVLREAAGGEALLESLLRDTLEVRQGWAHLLPGLCLHCTEVLAGVIYLMVVPLTQHL